MARRRTPPTAPWAREWAGLCAQVIGNASIWVVYTAINNRCNENLPKMSRCLGAALPGRVAGVAGGVGEKLGDETE